MRLRSAGVPTKAPTAPANKPIPALTAKPGGFPSLSIRDNESSYRASVRACVCACVRACVRACVSVCVRACLCVSAYVCA